MLGRPGLPSLPWKTAAAVNMLKTMESPTKCGVRAVIRFLYFITSEEECCPQVLSIFMTMLGRILQLQQRGSWSVFDGKCFITHHHPPGLGSLWFSSLCHGRLARWRKWKSCDVGEAKEGWRMSCDVGQATEGLENELWRWWSDWKIGEWAQLKERSMSVYAISFFFTFPVVTTYCNLLRCKFLSVLPSFKINLYL